MIGCLRTRVRKQPIIALYSECETVLRFYNLEVWWFLSSNTRALHADMQKPYVFYSSLQGIRMYLKPNVFHRLALGLHLQTFKRLMFHNPVQGPQI